MTENERIMLCEIGRRVAGPRHVVVMATNHDVLELVSSLTEKGLVKSAVFAESIGGEEMLRVCLTGKGWISYRAT